MYGDLNKHPNIHVALGKAFVGRSVKCASNVRMMFFSPLLLFFSLFSFARSSSVLLRARTAQAPFLSVFIVRLMCYHRMSLYSSSRAIVFHVAVGKAGGGQSALVALTYNGRSSTNFLSLQCYPGQARLFPGVLMCFCCPLVS